ncbi:MAG: DUF1771 domain-containing protein [Candidatus Saccharibacteria bacterium]|nr:DUF1771 domain-containing protein [Candidatus Saccharibacteria bacterium]
MPRDYELDRIKSEEQTAFQRKQSAWARYAEARNRTNVAHNVMESAWEERCKAREEMNREYELMQSSSERYREVWDEYGRIRDYNNSRIESLHYEADSEHQEMQRCFEQASSEYQYGDKSMAPVYSQEGHEHKNRRDELNAEISALGREVKEAKNNAMQRAHRTNSSAFQSAKASFEQAKARHEAAQARFKSLKAERDEAKAEFDSAQAEHKRLKEEFQSRLAEVKSRKQRERDRVLDKAGVRWSERKDAKIVKKADGTTQIYSGGLGGGDGLGHGHVALDSSGHKTYERDAFMAHGSQNYTDRKTSGWSPIERGVIGEHQVTFRQGLGDKEGQTLISDGHITGKQFHSHHNHYGPNDRSRYPNEPGRIEDSSKHKGDTFYTGPGH